MLFHDALDRVVCTRNHRGTAALVLSLAALLPRAIIVTQWWLQKSITQSSCCKEWLPKHREMSRPGEQFPIPLKNQAPRQLARSAAEKDSMCSYHLRRFGVAG